MRTKLFECPRLGTRTVLRWLVAAAAALLGVGLYAPTASAQASPADSARAKVTQHSTSGASDHKASDHKASVADKDDEGSHGKGKPTVKIAHERVELPEPIYFDTAKATINKHSFPMLRQVAALLAAHPEITKVRVEAHTDSPGKASVNRKRSQARAQAVVDFLVDHGVARDRLVARGYGESEPIADNATAPGRARNRRMVLTILGIKKTTKKTTK